VGRPDSHGVRSGDRPPPGRTPWRWGCWGKGWPQGCRTARPRIACHRQAGHGHGLHQTRLQGARVRQHQGAQGLRQRDPHMEIGALEALRFAGRAPRRWRAALTLGAMPMTPGIVGVLGVVTGGTRRQVASQSGRPAGRHGPPDTPLLRRDRRASARDASPYCRPPSATARTGRRMTGSPGGGSPGGSASHGGHAGASASIGASSGGSEGRASVGAAVDPPPLRGAASPRGDAAHADGSPSGGPRPARPAGRPATRPWWSSGACGDGRERARAAAWPGATPAVTPGAMVARAGHTDRAGLCLAGPGGPCARCQCP